jgi:hypothetical protein
MGVRVREPRCRSNRAVSCPCLLRHASCVGLRAVEAHFNGAFHRSRVKIRLNTRNKRLNKVKSHSPLERYGRTSLQRFQVPLQQLYLTAVLLYWPLATGPPVIFPNSCLTSQLPSQLFIIFLKSCSRASSRASYLISFRILGASSRSGQLLKASRVLVDLV